MSESTVQTVECELCGESFDPTDAGGWCTNPDCGEWQYAGAELSNDAGADAEEDATADEGSVDDETPDTDEASEESAGIDGEAADEIAETEEATDSAVSESDADESTDDESAGEGTDGPRTTDSADEPDISGTDDDELAAETVDAAAEATSESDGTDERDSIVECVDCGVEVERDANFCPTCGGEVVERQVADDGDLTECPSCDAAVEPDDNFCASCGEDLDAHRTSEELTECPDCGADVEEDDAFCANCGENLDAHRSEAAGDDGTTESGGDSDADSDVSPERLSLTAYDQSIEVEDGDAIGREVRALLAEAGRPDDEAVRIHREHVRFVREDGQFYLVDLGDNPTAVDGTTLSKGDRQAIELGDEITLSDVVTLTVGSADA